MAGSRLEVRVGHLVSPSTCWVSPLQTSDGLDAPEDAAIAAVVDLEEVGGLVGVVVVVVVVELEEVGGLVGVVVVVEL